MSKMPVGKKLCEKLASYIEECKKSDNKHALPNIAGFCRYIGASPDELQALKKTHPDDHAAVMTYLEDAALNSGATASLVNMYLRQYGFWSAPVADEFTCDHDMDADGI